MKPDVSGPTDPVSDAPRAGARPGGRSARVVSAVLEATRAELARVGFGALSVERVAEIAGVAKTTIYRRWPQKAGLVRDALVQRMQAKLELPEDHGSLLDQLTAYTYGRAQDLQLPEGQGTARMLYGESQNPGVQELVRALRSATLEGPRELFQRAALRGEIAAGVDGEAAWQMIMGSLHHRVFLLGETPSRSAVQELVRAVLFGVLAAPLHEGLSPCRERS